MTWVEVCEDKLLNSLPYRIETDRWGHIVMSPPPRSRHAEYQGRIVTLINERLKGGLVIPECPVETSDGVKAIDVAWVSQRRRDSKPNDPVYLIAPEICVEVLSPSNTPDEIAYRKRLFLERGAIEFWTCDSEGGMEFFDAVGQIPKSELCPGFPKKVELQGAS
jgi:Uma2 family endonuclease